MSHSVALTFEDGVTRFVTCGEDQTVADASYRARINIPVDCRDGVCGTCKAVCESGEFDAGSYLEDALSPDEERSGYVLPCSMKPRSDLVLRIPTTSAVAKTNAASHHGRITGLDCLSPTTVALTVEIDEREKLAFLPGQYVNVTVPGTEMSRSYSFSSAPDEPRLSFLIKLSPGGVMSEYLTSRARVGDEISFTGPHGSFFLRESDNPLLLLVGGTGLAPILSILRTLAGQGTNRPMHLLYGVTTDDDLVELDTLASLARTLATLSWDYCVADEKTTAPNQGYVTTLIRREHLHDGRAATYLCGPPAMVDAVRRHVTDTGIEPSGFYYEKFALAAQPPTPASREKPQRESGKIPARVADSPRAAATLACLAGPEARALAGQVALPGTELIALGDGAPTTGTSSSDAGRRLTGQELARPGASGERRPLDEGLDEGDDLLPDPSTGTRSLAGQELFPAAETTAPTAPTARPEPAEAEAEGTVLGSGGYQIGEEHPPVHESDALFDARCALELGALELVLGRLTSRQLTGYRLLAEATVPYVQGDRFTDAAAYTETNTAFHDYLFTLTGNEHLSQAYNALGVKGHMEEHLRNATWCHRRCAQDHLEIVAAIGASDRAGARQLIREHAERSKETTRRAMRDAAPAARARFVSPGRFAGKIVVVTGAAQGIGRAVAERAAREGGSLVLIDRSTLVHETVDAIIGEGGTAVGVEADLERFSCAQEAIDQAHHWRGRIDVLINNVGGAIWFQPFVEFSDTEIEAEIRRSLLPTLWCCRATLPGMVSRGAGVIVNVSSAATRGIHRIPYSAAKGGVNAITASLALEYAEAGIRVVATAPGGTEAPPRRVSRGGSALETDQEKTWYQAHIDQTIDSSPMRRYGTLDEQAAAILFLASDEASYITGAVLPVAGGDLG